MAQGARLILGPVFRDSVAAAAVPARARGVNIVAFSTDAAVAGDGVYLLAFLPGPQVERVVSYAVSRGHRRFAALAPETPYGAAVIEALRASVFRNGGTLALVERYAGAEDAMEPARRLARLDDPGGPGFDAVLVAAGGRELRRVAPLLPFFDIDPAEVQFLGTGLWDGTGLGDEPALVGGWYAAPPPEIVARFYDRFAEHFPYRPPRIATLAYDAVALAAALSRESAPGFSREALYAAQGFAGADGIFRFGTDGRVQRGLAVLEVRPDGPAVVDPAPVAFPAPEG